MGVLFGTDGIRGQANAYPITPEVAMLVGKAVAKLFATRGKGKNRVLIGKDTRLSGYMLETALTSGLVSMGMDVFLVGPIPTPAVAHLTKSMGAVAGIMLTASHNPHGDNGIKIFGGDGFKLSDDLEERVEFLVLNGEIESKHISSALIGKAFRIDDARGRYIEYAKSMIHGQSLKGLRIILDCANGASYFIGPLIFKELGAQVTKVAVEPDGLNINHGCGALFPENIGQMVVDQEADVGICFDGDADRVIFCDEKGTVVDGDRILAMCAKDLKDAGELAGDTLVVTSMTNLGLHAAMKEAGIKVAVTDVGDRNVIECMRAHGYNLGGEKSGHLIFSDYATTGDGILSALQVLSLMGRTGKSLSELADCMDEYPQRLESFYVAAKPPLETLTELCGQMTAAEEDMGDQGRVVIRYSGTENKMRVLVECADSEKTDLWTEKLVKTAKKEIG